MKNELNSTPINVAIAGYGHLGSKLIDRIKPDETINIISIIEPDPLKRQQIIQTHVCKNVYAEINEILEGERDNIDLIIDCSTKGQGQKNKIDYEKLNLPAIFQNGEKIETGTLYYPGLYTQESPDAYMRIPCCSAISVLRIVEALTRADIPKPQQITSYNVKTSNDPTTSMMSMNYVSGQEIKQLTNIETRTNRIYLRGKPNNHDYVYAGNVQLIFEKGTKLNQSKILQALEDNPEISLEGQNIDTNSYPRTTNTVIIKESVDINKQLGLLTLALISFPPEIDIPANLEAIKLHSLKKTRKIRN